MARRGRRTARSTLLLRWAAVGALVLVGLLYVRPLHAYLETRASLNERRDQVHALEARKRSLERRLTRSISYAMLERQARRLGYVKPGERLYIVKGIGEWRKKLRATLRGGG